MTDSQKNILFYFIFLALYMILFSLGNFDAGDRQTYFNIIAQTAPSPREEGFNFIIWLLGYIGVPPLTSLYLFAFSIFSFAYVAVVQEIKDQNIKYYAFGIIFFGILSLFSIGLLRGALANWIAVFLYLNYLRTSQRRFLAALPLVLTLHVQMIPFVGSVFAYHAIGIPIWALFSGATLSILALVNFPEFVVTTLSLPGGYAGYVSNAQIKNSLLFSPLMWSYFGVNACCGLIHTKRKQIGIRLAFIGLPFGIVAFFTGYDLISRFSTPFMFLLWVYFFKYCWPFFQQRVPKLAYHVLCSALIIASLFYAYFRHSIA